MNWVRDTFLSTLVLALGAGLGLSALPSRVSAQTEGAQPAPLLQLTLQDALRLAAESDPRLQAQVFLRQGADARRAQAALRPATSLSADIENVLGTGNLRTFRDAELTLSLGTTLEMGSKREQRMAVATREIERMELQLQAARLDAFAEVARRFIVVLQSQEILQVVRDDKALAARIQQIVAGRVASGVALPVEQSNAEVASIQAHLAEQQAESFLREAWGQLVVAWGGAPESTGRVLGDLFKTPLMPAFVSVQDAVERNPDILVFASERRVREATLALAEAQRAPDVDVNAGLRRFQATHDQALVLSASIPLGTSGRAAPTIAEARSQLNAAQAEDAAKRNDVVGTLYGLRQRADAARGALELLQEGALPAAQRAQAQAEAAFRAGRSSLLELIAAQRQHLDLQRAKIDAAATYHRLVIDLERLMGVPLETAYQSSIRSQSSDSQSPDLQSSGAP